jgi:predicted aconitase with swiveling domain
MAVTARPILAGRARGPVLRLDHPLSFWGGVDPASGTLLAPPQCSIAGTVLMLPTAIGSSSSSAVLLELLRNGQAPAALILGQIDAILGLGILAAGEMGWKTIPLLVLDVVEQARFETGRWVEIDAVGRIDPMRQGAGIQT